MLIDNNWYSTRTEQTDINTRCNQTTERTRNKKSYICNNTESSKVWGPQAKVLQEHGEGTQRSRRKSKIRIVHRKVQGTQRSGALGWTAQSRSTSETRPWGRRSHGRLNSGQSIWGLWWSQSFHRSTVHEQDMKDTFIQFPCGRNIITSRRCGPDVILTDKTEFRVDREHARLFSPLLRPLNIPVTPLPQPKRAHEALFQMRTFPLKICWLWTSAGQLMDHQLSMDQWILGVVSETCSGLNHGWAKATRTWSNGVQLCHRQEVKPVKELTQDEWILHHLSTAVRLSGGSWILTQEKENKRINTRKRKETIKHRWKTLR